MNHHIASMEPPSFDGGNVRARSALRSLLPASMEPPSFDGGNAVDYTGAAGKGTLQWSRRLSTAETPNLNEEGAMDAQELQWSRRLSTAETL